MTDRELDEKLLEALAHLNRTGDTQVFDLCYAPELIPALRERLAREEQEPVAWQWLDTGTFRKSLPTSAEPGAWRPLYTAPQPAREWQGLTDEEMHDTEGYVEDRALYRFARAIEAKLKEKNG